MSAASCIRFESGYHSVQHAQGTAMYTCYLAQQVKIQPVQSTNTITARNNKGLNMVLSMSKQTLN
jgi:hypothetical protein